MNIIKRFYHPGLISDKKLCLPICLEKNKSIYYKHVWGNKIQELQLKQNNTFFYNTNDINKHSKKIKDFYNEDIIFLPSSHNTPLKTSLQSLRNIDSYKFISEIDNNIVNNKGIFINTSENRKSLMNLLNFCYSDNEKDIIKSAIYGIFSNFGDSIYIANDYLSIDKNKIIVSNYPNKVSSREIEKCRIIANSLIYGNYPILLDNHINFEGEANIKYIPAMIYENKKYYQLCFTYNSSRSSTMCINNINEILEKFNLPLLREITLFPKKNLEKYFYHLDCIMNFYSNNKYQYFTSEMDFWKNYKKNGTIVVEINGVNNRQVIEEKFKKIFKDIIYVNKDEDLLCANMIMMKKGIVGSDKIKNKNSFIENNKTYFFTHPSLGGGGAHKCCSNVLNKNSEITIDEWTDFLKDNNLNINNNLVDGVNDELKRIKKNFSNYI